MVKRIYRLYNIVIQSVTAETTNYFTNVMLATSTLNLNILNVIDF